MNHISNKKINNKEDNVIEAIKIANSKRIKDDKTIDIYSELNKVLSSIGLGSEEVKEKIFFSGKDPIVPSVLHLASAAAIGMAVKSIAVSNIWELRGGKSQNISIDLRKILHRLSPFYDKKWEKLNGFSPRSLDPFNPFSLKMFKTKDNRWVMPLNLYPRLKHETLSLLRSSEDSRDVENSILKWNALELEEESAKKGVVMPMIRTVEEFLAEPVCDYLGKLPLIQIEKIGESEPMPLSKGVSSPLEGIKALGMGHVIAGAGIGRALALYGADVLNIWRPGDFEHDMLYCTANVGVRSTTLEPLTQEGYSTIKNLLKDADIFYANRRFGYLERMKLTAEDCAEIHPGIIHVNVSLHGESGPWANRPGFDQTAGCVSGVMSLEGTPSNPKLPPISVVNDYLVAWLASAGALAALKRRAKEGGSYKVTVSLTRVSMWLLSLGIFDKEFAYSTANSSEEHNYLAPNLFTAETTLGHYQGVTEQVIMSETPGEYKTVLVPRGSCKAEWI